MDTTTVERSTRGASPILLVLAALCFLLPLVGVSCNASGLQGLAGSVGAATGGGAQASACLSAISNSDIYSYSGVDLATGRAPSTISVPASCSSTAGSSAARTPTVGVQPLLIAVLVLILIGIAATVLRSPRRQLVALAAALLGAAFLLVENSIVRGTISDRLTSLADSSSPNASGFNLQQLGGAGNFFNIHAAIGFTLMLIALGLAAAANLAGLLASNPPRGAPALPQGAGPAPPPPPPAPPPERL